MKVLKPILPIILALAIAGGGSLYIFRWIENKTGPKNTVAVEKTEAVPVVVAAMDLNWGTKLTVEMLKTLPYLKQSLPQGYVSDPALIKDRIVVANLKQGEPVVEHRLAGADVKIGGVSALLASGKRAVAVKGDKVIGISGFIVPGNRVDVLATIRDPNSREERTKIVLENITVLATGTQMEKDSKGQPAPVDVYTLEVTPAESEKLALAAAAGKLQFALRNDTDAEQAKTSGATIQQTMRNAAPAVTKKDPPAPPSSTSVEVIKGGAVSQQKVKL